MKSYRTSFLTIHLSYRATKLPSYRAIQLSSYQATKLSSYQATKLPSYRAIKLPSYQAIQLSSYQATELPSYQAIELSSYQATKLPSYPATKPSAISYKLKSLPLTTYHLILSMSFFCVTIFYDHVKCIPRWLRKILPAPLLLYRRSIERFFPAS